MKASHAAEWFIHYAELAEMLQHFYLEAALQQQEEPAPSAGGGSIPTGGVHSDPTQAEALRALSSPPARIRHIAACVQAVDKTVALHEGKLAGRFIDAFYFRGLPWEGLQQELGISQRYFYALQEQILREARQFYAESF